MSEVWLTPPRCSECNGQLRTPDRHWHYQGCVHGRTDNAAAKEYVAALERSNAIEAAAVPVERGEE